MNDPIGTPERLVRPDGEIARELRRKAWGETEPTAGGAASTPTCFQGQYDDDEIALVYNRWRYYDDGTGRFIASDPVGIVAGCNPFRYVPNSIRWVDPFGLTAEELAAAMPAAGRPLLDGQTAHHIVPENADRGQDARDILARNEIDVNSADNGAALWGTHPNQRACQGHPQKDAAGKRGVAGAGNTLAACIANQASTKVTTRLAAAEKKDGSGGVRAELAKLRGEMQAGTFNN